MRAINLRVACGHAPTGTFSTVYKARRKDNGEQVALKVVLPTSGPDRTQNEQDMLMRHGGQDHIVKCLGAIRTLDYVTIEMKYFPHGSFKV